MADVFEVIQLGRTPEQAFDAAKEYAYYWYGHAGYTGTIAEKPGFTYGGKVSSYVFDRIVDDLRIGWSKDLPKLSKKIVNQWYDVFISVEGPALCLEVTGTRRREIKDHFGRKGTHDNVYLFCGRAPTKGEN